ncbi:hypothetical protein SKAU_G00387810 [Synaphobranchus kaupii]|uniref:Uncharacterized protein n=1 Tax=Synaphobranchus kaupii TaxID=118154 RepID=A0A9Q1EAY6_SYNKA|nr:hypothetical protein SKAU_G00387810 [Synaphobranchus kaupii]
MIGSDSASEGPFGSAASRAQSGVSATRKLERKHCPSSSVHRPKMAAQASIDLPTPILKRSLLATQQRNHHV